MLLQFLLGAFHLLALPVGLGGIWMRARSLSRVPAEGKPAVESALAADNAWGIAALLWLGTGILRAFFGFEKGWGYYSTNALFWIKMGLFVTVVALEIWPMITFIRWRITTSRGGTPDLSRAPLFARTSTIQAAIVVAMVFLAAGMARGLGSN